MLALIIIGVLGRFLGAKGVQVITVITVGAIAGISWWNLIFEVPNLVIRELDLFSWIDTGLLAVGWSFLFDSLAVSMLVVVSSISFAVHLFSIDYMEKDPHKGRLCFI